MTHIGHVQPNPFSNLDLPPRGLKPTTPGADPGTPRAAKIAWIITIVSLLFTVYLNQWGHGHLAALFAGKPASVGAATAPIDPVNDPPPSSNDALDLQMRLAMRFASYSQLFEQFKNGVDDMLARDRPSETDRARYAMLLAAAYDYSPRSAGPTALEAIDLALNGAKNPGIRADLEITRRIYAAGSAALAGVGDAELTRLRDRHDVYGELTASLGDKTRGEWRQSSLTGGMVVVLVMGAVGLCAIGAFIAGLVLFIMQVPRVFAASETSMTPPAPGGSLAIETVAAFTGIFAVYHFAAVVLRLALPTAEWVGGVAVAGQWLLALTIFYPMLRGMTWTDTRSMLGLTSGRGVLREIGYGIAAYCAALPMVVVALVVTVFVRMIQELLAGSGSGLPGSGGGSEQHLSDNPIIQIVTNASAWEVVTLFLLGTVWAPLVEETIMRGGLFRALRSRWAVPSAAAVSSLVFAMMHGYPLLMMAPVFTLGFAFAIMRHKRTSLIAGMTAHALNNAVVLGFFIFMFRAAIARMP